MVQDNVLGPMGAKSSSKRHALGDTDMLKRNNDGKTKKCEMGSLGLQGYNFFFKKKSVLRTAHTTCGRLADVLTSFAGLPQNGPVGDVPHPKTHMLLIFFLHGHPTPRRILRCLCHTWLLQFQNKNSTVSTHGHCPRQVKSISGLKQ